MSPDPARRPGQILLDLPREIRDEIYFYIALYHEEDLQTIYFNLSRHILGWDSVICRSGDFLPTFLPRCGYANRQVLHEFLPFCIPLSGFVVATPDELIFLKRLLKWAGSDNQLRRLTVSRPSTLLCTPEWNESSCILKNVTILQLDLFHNDLALRSNVIRKVKLDMREERRDHNFKAMQVAEALFSRIHLNNILDLMELERLNLRFREAEPFRKPLGLRRAHRWIGLQKKIEIDFNARGMNILVDTWSYYVKER